MAKLKITRADGSVSEHQITPRIENAFELYAKKGYQTFQSLNTVEEEKVETYEICCVFFKKLAHDQNIARGSRLCNTVSSPFPF